LKLIGRIVRVIIGLSALVTLWAGAMALAGGFGWPMELFQAWPWMIATLCLAACGIGLLAKRPKLSAANALVALLLVVNALLSIGGLPDHTGPQGKMGEDDGYVRLAWANVMRERPYAQAFVQTAQSFGANIVAAGEAPAGRRDFEQLAAPLDNLTKQGAIMVAGCATDGVALRSVAGEKGPLNGKSRVFAQKVSCPDFTLFAVHARNPLWRWGARLTQRTYELNALAKAIKDTSGPVVVVGDFNTPPNTQALKLFAQTSGARRIACAGRWRPTWRPYPWREAVPAGLPLTGIPIDHLFVRDVNVTACRVGQDFGSDHLPLLVEFETPQAKGSQE
jgi:Endonuclease/Exonuclease/phosphatase family